MPFKLHYDNKFDELLNKLKLKTDDAIDLVFELSELQEKVNGVCQRYGLKSISIMRTIANENSESISPKNQSNADR